MSSFNDVLAGLQAISAWQERVYKQLHATAGGARAFRREIKQKLMKQIGVM